MEAEDRVEVLLGRVEELEANDLVESQLKEIQRLNDRIEKLQRKVSRLDRALEESDKAGGCYLDRIEELDGKLTMQSKALFDESCEWFKDKHIITDAQIDELVRCAWTLRGLAVDVIIGEHYVTHEMALDAGMPEAEGSHYGYEYGSEKVRCPSCNGSGRVIGGEDE
jgi:hypothetical protein